MLLWSYLVLKSYGLSGKQSQSTKSLLGNSLLCCLETFSDIEVDSDISDIEVHLVCLCQSQSEWQISWSSQKMSVCSEYWPFSEASHLTEVTFNIRTNYCLPIMAKRLAQTHMKRPAKSYNLPFSSTLWTAWSHRSLLFYCPSVFNEIVLLMIMICCQMFYSVCNEIFFLFTQKERNYRRVQEYDVQQFIYFNLGYELDIYFCTFWTELQC